MSDQSEPGTDLVLGGAVTAVVAFGPGNAAKLLDGIEGIFRFCKRLDHMLSGKK